MSVFPFPDVVLNGCRYLTSNTKTPGRFLFHGFFPKENSQKNLFFSTILKFDSKKLFRYTWTRAPDIRMFSRKSFFLNDISIRFIDVLCCQHSQWSCLRSDLLSLPILQPQSRTSQPHQTILSRSVVTSCSTSASHQPP